MNPFGAVETIFWDNDGVLVDTEHLYYRASKEILAEEGIALSWQCFQDLSLRQGKSVFALADSSGFSVQRQEQMRLRRNRRYEDLLHLGAQTMDGAEEALSQLHGRLPMAIVTSSLRKHFDIIHRHTGLLRFFDFVLTREDYTHSKPHPEPYLTALTRSRQAARHCLVIEDSERGLHAATRAGIPCVVLASDPPASAFNGAAAIISSLRDLPSLLN